jgi:FKBP-type peptidyl-prolyl cis-trans isomerase FkpA
MKKFLYFLILPVIIASCNKSDANKCTYTESTNVATAAEISYLGNYLTTNSITASQHSSGIFYNTTNQGTGTVPGVCSTITLKYTGSLLNGTVFDSYTGAAGISFVLGELIPGWQKGLPLIKAGGSITLYIPPSLGYGAVDVRDQNGNVVIPANSYLKFTIDLLDVQ